MLGHIGINVPDLRSAKSYYSVLMPLLGFEVFRDAGDEFAYRPMGGKPGTYLFFYPATDRGPSSPEPTGLQHLAFIVRTRSEVRMIHQVIENLAPQFGGRVLHEPQNYPQYPQPYFATFWIDPWGFKLEAVCHHDRP
jgi:catechol 2,3-dioxygenase-like lactoylglutathione lyase family enzyme